MKVYGNKRRRLFVYKYIEVRDTNTPSTYFYVKDNAYDKEETLPTVVKVKKIYKATPYYKFFFIDNITSVEILKDKDGNDNLVVNVDNIRFDYTCPNIEDYMNSLNVDTFFSPY